MPDVIKNGHFYIAIPPLYRIIEGKEYKYFKNTKEYDAFISNKIFSKYKVGRVIKKEDGSIGLKPFTKNQFVDFLMNTENYKTTVTNIANIKAIDPSLIEFIINTSFKTYSGLIQKINKKFPDLECTLLKNKKGIHIEGAIGDNQHFADLDDEFFSTIEPLSKILNDNNYKNLFYKEEGKKSVKCYISELLSVLLAYGTPKNRTRFKGLGEMDYDELWMTTMSPSTGNIVQIKANSIKELAKAFETHFGSDANKRKIFLSTFEISPDDIDN